MSDLIRRQDAIDAIEAQKADEWIESDVDFNHGMDMARSIVATLPSAESVHGWIPVSEKPKDEERTYLVQLDSGGMRSCRWTNANPFWTELTTDWHWNMFDIPQYCNVVAWMDLEPYKGGEDE